MLPQFHVNLVSEGRENVTWLNRRVNWAIQLKQKMADLISLDFEGKTINFEGKTINQDKELMQT